MRPRLNLIDLDLDEMIVQPGIKSGTVHIGTISKSKGQVASVLLEKDQVNLLIEFLQNCKKS